MWYRRARAGIGVVLAAAFVALLVVVAFGQEHKAGDAAATGRPWTTAEYLPGLAADVVLPRITAHAPVVVLVPGGGWRTADRSGLLPLARALADGGAVAVAVTYKASDQGGRLADTVGELGCAAGFAAARARAAGIEPGPVVLLGHSSGAHLAALAALAPSRFPRLCSGPPARIDGFVGLAGAYEPASFGALADPFFAGPVQGGAGHDADPDALAAHADHRLRVLLLHGDADEIVPPAMTSRFALALRTGGHDVTAHTLPGENHAGAYAAGPVAPQVLTWLRGWNALP